MVFETGIDRLMSRELTARTNDSKTDIDFVATGDRSVVLPSVPYFG